jgi:3-isopropylmalate dehydratase small subunit
VSNALSPNPFSYIYSRSQPNLGIVGIVLTDQEFHNLAIDSAEVEVNLGRRLVSVAGKSFPFVMDDMEIRLIENKGLSEAYRRFGKSMFKTLTEGKQDAPLEAETVGNELAW